MAFINLITVRLNITPFYERAHYLNNGSIRGIPFHWKSDFLGDLPKAMTEFFNQNENPVQLKMIITYLQYHISAPCWLEERKRWTLDDDFIQSIEKLRSLSQELKTRADIENYIQEALNIGIDPL